MLGKLLQTLKSEKSTKPVAPQQSAQQQTLSNESVYSPLDYKLDSELTQGGIVNGKVQKVRYFVLKDLPNIFNQVLGCPLSVFHHLPHGQRKVKEISIPDQHLPTYLQFLRPLLVKEIPNYNHILINDYPSGIGIMAHSDGPAYFPKVLVLSLNSYCLIKFQKSYSSSEEKAPAGCQVLLQPNSIHIFESQAYTEYLHGIDNYEIDSMLLKYSEEQAKVLNCSVDNYHLLHCRQEIEAEIKKGEMETSLQGGLLRLIKLVGNQEYSHKVEISRKQRISITIRQKYE